MILALFVALAETPAAPASTIAVVYTVTFDVDQDALCAMTQFCDCSATYLGTGKQIAADKSRVTFEGDWTVTQNTCHDALAIWTPADGKAFHTLRHGAKTLDEWVVHSKADQHARRTEGMKENGQFWINELKQPWPGTIFQSQQNDSGSISGLVNLATTHDLHITLTK